MKFTKMQAFGNDYVYIDAINQKLENLPALARFVSDRHFAIGSDGMVLICPSEVADFRMRMFNPDGSEGEMCGNAVRSVGKFVYDHRFTDKEHVRIETLGGIKDLWFEVTEGYVSNITANIGAPIFDTTKIPVNVDTEEFIDEPVKILDREFNISAVSWGNPHCVAFLEDDLKDFDVDGYGKAIEYHTELFTNKTNVTFAKVINRNYIKMREWERGTGETIGCGTGCCTAFVVANRLGLVDDEAEVEQIGGNLKVKWDKQTGDVYMTGPSHTVFESEIEVDFDNIK
ncbi:MAG: diaminopimelate epimerase [Lachnospiraceae bacterium]|nr:diaminopimelate epimerase [Lachnospiraceae bacterium]